MPDLASLIVEVTDKGISVTTKELQKLTKASYDTAKATDKATAANKKLDDQAKKSGKTFLEMSSGFKIVGRDLSRYITLPLLAAGAASFKFGSDLNKGLALVESLIPGTTGRIDELGEAVKDLAVESGKGFSDLTEGLYQTISAFQDGADTVDRFTTVTNAAVAGNASVRSSLELLSAVTKGYDDTTAEAVEHVSDLAFEAIRLGQTTFPELAASIQKVTSLSSTMGVSQEELFAVFAALTGVTGDAAEVSTQFASVLASLLTPSKEMTKLLGKLGLASGEALIEEKGLIGALKTVANTADASGISLFKFTKRKEALKAVIALTTAQEDEFITKLDSLNNAAGASDMALSAITDGTNKYGFALKQATARLAVVGAEVYDVFIPALTEAVTLVSEIAATFVELDPVSKQVIINLTTLVAVMGPLLIVFGSLIRLTALLKVSMLALGISFAPIAIGLAAITLATIAYGIATGLSTRKQENFTKSLLEFQKAGQHTEAELTALGSTTIDYNTAAGASVSVNKELLDVYPELVDQVDIFTVSNEELLVVLREINQERALAEAPDLFKGAISDIEDFLKQSTRVQGNIKEINKALSSDISDRDIINPRFADDLEASIDQNISSLDRLGKSYVVLAEDTGAALATLNEDIAPRGIEAFIEDGTVLFKKIPLIAKGAMDEVKDEVAETVILGGDTGEKGLKTWQEWFESVTGVATAEFSTLREVFDAQGALISRSFLGKEQGKKAGAAYIAGLNEEISNKTLLNDIIGDPTGNLFNFEETSSKIDTMKSDILELLSIKAALIAKGETFEFQDKAITAITEEIKLAKELQAIYASGVISDSVIEDTKAIDSMNMALGRELDSYDALTDKLGVYEKALEEALDLEVPDASLVADLGLQIETTMDAIASTFQGAKDGVKDFTSFLEEELFNALSSLVDLAPGVALALAEIGASLSLAGIDAAAAAFEGLGEAFADGAVSGEEFRAVMYEQAKAILDLLPGLFLQAGLQLIARGNLEMGLGFVAAGLTSSFISGLIGGATNNATGNAFSEGNIVPFAKGGSFTNTIVTQPTMFEFGGALGQMGEAGDEAILPLSRTASGNLGVEASGVGGGGTSVTVNVINNSGESVETKETDTPDGKEIEIIIGQVVSKQLADGKYDKTMRGRYGSKVQGVSA